ncbi:MAG: endonuclease/exonuclease/phosphatase family protein [Acidobacteriota bacterium]|nr:endonuclease/exonuclease/phosphatase family protein [Acidobacteriota bacterium]
MKLTTWNCARGFEKKKGMFFSIDPDIAVIQECSKSSTESVPCDGYNAAWVGANLNIGMGVFFKKTGWHVRRLEDATHGIRWVVPFEVKGPENFTLIAIWACQVKGSKRQSYVGQISRALNEHPEWFENGPVVVAGDFNSNARWDDERRDWNHSTMVAGLRSRGLESIYHATSGEAHGKETTPTFHLQKNKEKDFHLDYIFAPDSWHQRLQMTLEDCSKWLPHSDHCPLTLSLSPKP